MAAPTFEAIEFYAKAVNAEVVKIPLAATYAHQLVKWRKPSGKNGGLIYVCNPNNPTASVTPRRSLEIFIRSLPPNTYVLMDEAYHDFVPVAADYISFLATPIDEDRVIVARTSPRSMAWPASGWDMPLRRPKTAKPWRPISLRTAPISWRCAPA